MIVDENGKLVLQVKDVIEMEESSMRFALGEQVAFAEEPECPYTIKAISERYAILTRPATEEDARAFEVEMPLEGVVVYTIIDRDEMVRGPNELVFNMYDYAKQGDIDQCLAALDLGMLGLSRRRSIPVLLVERIMSAGDFAEYLREGMEECRRRPFRALPFYSSALDMVLFYARDEKSYHKCITHHLGLFLATGDESYVGCKIEGVHDLMNWDLGIPRESSMERLVDVAREAAAYDQEDRKILDRLWPVVRASIAGVRVVVG